MQDFVFLKVEKLHVRVRFSDILMIQADKKYVTVVTQDRSFLTLSTMNHIEKMLPQDSFCRIHRSYIVALGQICHFDNELVHIGNRKIPIAEKYLSTLKNSVVIINGDTQNR